VVGAVFELLILLNFINLVFEGVSKAAVGELLCVFMLKLDESEERS